MKRLIALFLFTIFCIIFFIVNSFKNVEKQKIYLKSPPEMRVFLDNLAKKYEKINKNIEVVIIYEDFKNKYKNDCTFENFYYFKNNSKDYKMWLELSSNKNKSKEELNKNNYHLFLNSQDYRLKNRYLKDDITIFNERYLEEFFRKQNYKISFFTYDELVILGRLKIDYLENINKDSLSVVSDNLDISNLSNQILKAYNLDKRNNIIYSKDSIEALENVELYECDYALIGKIPASLAKNSYICHKIPKFWRPYIRYSIALKNIDNKDALDFYNFLTSEKTKKYIKNYI